MKLCTRCGPPAQPIENFALRNRATGRYSTVCRACQNKYGRQHYETYKDIYVARARKRNEHLRQVAREYVVNFLREHPCVDCGEADPVVLEFDHQHSKREAIGDMIRAAVNLDVLIAEIEKCEVVCSNCHKRRTAKTYNWYKGR